MIDFIYDIYIIAWFTLRFFSEILGGGGNELSLRFIILLTHGLFCVILISMSWALKPRVLPLQLLLHQTHPWKILLRLAASVLLVPGG